MIYTQRAPEVFNREGHGWAVRWYRDNLSYFTSPMPDEATARRCAASAAMEEALRAVVDWHEQPEDKDPREWSDVVREVRAALKQAGTP